MVAASLLRTTPLFATASPAALRALAAGTVERRAAAGAVLFNAGAPARGLVVLLAGRVRVVRAVGPRQHVVHHESPGGTLGEIPLYAGGGYPATAIAFEECRYLVVSRAAIDGALRADPSLAWGLLERLAGRTRSLIGRLDEFAAATVGARLARFVLDRSAGRAGVPFTLGGSQEQVAEELGTVREVVVRELRRLRTAGLLAPAGRGAFVVSHVPALEQRAARRGSRNA
jgi:CRP-like cAMP-binding protein